MQAAEKEKTQNLSQINSLKTYGENSLLKIWGDPVFSKVIATGIILLMPFISAFIIKFLEDKSISDLFNNFLKLKIELYILLLIALILTVLYFIRLKYFQKRMRVREMFIAQKIGNYRLGELNNILLTTYITLPSRMNYQVGMNSMNLLELFQWSISIYSMGIGLNSSIDEDGFFYYTLGPILISYGLCQKIPSIKNNNDELDTYDIEISENGYKFFAMIERLARIEHEEIFRKEHEKRKKKREKSTL